MEGIAPSIADEPIQEIMFNNPEAFHALKQGFPFDKF